MKKEGIDELKKIFEKNIKEAGKEKNKQNIKDEKEKSGSFHDKNKQYETIKEKNIINKSVYISSSNNKLKDTFNKEINNKVKENELETIKKKLNSIIKKTEIKTEKKKEEKTNVDKKEIKPKEKKEEIKKLEKNDIKNEEIKKKEKISNEIKKMDAPDIKLQKNNLKDIITKFSKAGETKKNIENNINKNDIKVQTNFKDNPSTLFKSEINNENKKEKENNNINFKDKVAMFNNFIEKNKRKESETKYFDNRAKTYYIKDTIKNITKSNFDKNNNEVNEYKQTFDILHNLQNLLKKESSFKELCKIHL